MNDSNSENTGFGWMLFAGLGLVGLLTVLFFTFSAAQRRSLDHADGTELSATLQRWFEAGKPEGEKLAKFMEGRRSDLVVSNRIIGINGTNYVTQFAITKVKSHRSATLFVTTNKTLIWLEPSGDVEVLQ